MFTDDHAPLAKIKAQSHVSVWVFGCFFQDRWKTHVMFWFPLPILMVLKCNDIMLLFGQIHMLCLNLVLIFALSCA